MFICLGSSSVELQLLLPHLGKLILLSQITTKQHLLLDEQMSPTPCPVSQDLQLSYLITGLLTLLWRIPMTLA